MYTTKKPVSLHRSPSVRFWGVLALCIDVGAGGTLLVTGLKLQRQFVGSLGRVPQVFQRVLPNAS